MSGLGDLITVDCDCERGKLVFLKEDQGALVRSLDGSSVETAPVPVSGRRASAPSPAAPRANKSPTFHSYY